MPELPLDGCTPEPLMSYLKALGVLRLVSEQVDPKARGCWGNEIFLLHSRLDGDALLDFLLNRYQPTPLVAPWGARSGFYAGSSEKAARGALDSIMRSKDVRFARFRHLVERVKHLLWEMRISQKAADQQKTALLGACRSRLPDDILSWLDTCYVLLGDERRFPPLLGTGGNEGSGSYVSGFAQQVVSCLINREHDPALLTSLFAVPARDTSVRQTPGHFSGAAAGGANAGQGFDAQVSTNPWDYLLCLEGTCLWASGVVRRLGEAGPRMASFPFTVNVSGAGFASLALSDGAKPKKAKRDIAEIWLPVWSRSLGLPELRSLLAEGRATVGQRMATAGVDMARAVAGLGVDRGISSFKRNVFLMRNGQSFMATPAGTVDVKRRESVDLLREMDWWLDRFRSACGNKDAQPRFRAALRGIEQAIFDFCRYGGPRFFQAIVVALGRAERELARAGRFRDDNQLLPISGLSPEWISAANDSTEEFELALSLAGVFDPEVRVGSLRANLEPVVAWRDEAGKLAARWAEKDRAVVWNSANLPVNLAQVLARRAIDGDKAGCQNLPLASGNFASLSAVSRFLAGELDDRKIEELLWGLALVDQRSALVSRRPAGGDLPLLSRAYALLKLLFLPYPVQVGGQELRIKPEPETVRLLCGGRIGRACQIAARRLRATGLAPMPGLRSGGVVRDADWEELDQLKANGQRLAAALLPPISLSSVGALCELVVRKSEMKLPSV